MEVSITVNGAATSHDVEPRTLLVHHLRDNVGLTGTNIGCDSSSCGACTIHMNGARPTRGAVATNVGSGESNVVSKVMNQERSWFDVVTRGCAVDGDGYFHSLPPVGVAFFASAQSFANL